MCIGDGKMNKKISIIASVILVIAMIAVTALVNQNNNDRGELTGDEKTITITVSNKENQEIYNGCFKGKSPFNRVGRKSSICQRNFL